MQLCDEIGQVELGSPWGEVGKEVAVARLGVAASGSGADKGDGSRVMAMSSIENGPAVRSKDGVATTNATTLTRPICLTTATFRLATEVLGLVSCTRSKRSLCQLGKLGTLPHMWEKMWEIPT